MPVQSALSLRSVRVDANVRAQVTTEKEMKARFMIEAPDEIEATVKITMSVKEWTALRDQLENKWPSSRLGSAITQVISEARKVYYAQDQDAL
jgi:hypothetical protein